MNKRDKVIISSIIISLVLLASIFFAYHQGYLFKIKWYGDNPYDDFYCYVYNPYPKHADGLHWQLPPEYFGFYIDTNAPPDHTFVKIQYDIFYCGEEIERRTERIWLAGYSNEHAEIIKEDDDTYYVKYYVSEVTDESNFLTDREHAYYWKVEVYYCENPPTGVGQSIWYPAHFFYFYGGNTTDTWYQFPPVAKAGGPYLTSVGETLMLDGSGSYRMGYKCFLVEYIWDIYNDGTWDLVGKKVKVVFGKAGIYEVRLRVVQNNGLVDDDVTTVTVTNVNNPPVADADGPYSGMIGENIQLDGSGSYDPDGNPLSYEWDVDGDGTYDLTGRIVNVTYYQAGTFNVVLKVSDGQYSDTDTTTVMISSPPLPPPTNEPPVAEAGGPYECYADRWVVLDGSNSYDPDGYIVDYKWDIDNDGIWDLHGEKVNVTFHTVGTFVVKLNVTDDDGATAEDTTVVTVRENPTPPPPTPPEETDQSKNYWLFGILALLLLIPIGFIAWRDKNEKKKY